jgi:hypothetical protein
MQDQLHEILRPKKEKLFFRYGLRLFLQRVLTYRMNKIKQRPKELNLGFVEQYFLNRALNVYLEKQALKDRA